MTTAHDIAAFVDETTYSDLSESVRKTLTRHVLDAVGVAIATDLEGDSQPVFETVDELEAGGPCTVWGRSTQSSPTGAAMHNGTLVRELEYADAFLAPGETAHPSDCLAPIVAAGEYADRSGADLLTGLAIAYEIQGELAWNAPVREKGYDHVTHTIVAATAGTAKLLGLGREQIRHALAIAVTGHTALRATRAGAITEWNSVASANAARNAVYAVFLAKNGMYGPSDVIDGQHGWKDVITGPFELEFTPGERVHDVTNRRYVAEANAQSAVEGIVELATAEDLDPSTVTQIRLETFASARRTIGGGEGSRYDIETRTQAVHSLPYVLAVALVDRDLSLPQYDPDRIRRSDVQTLLERVEVTEDPALTERFEAGEMPAVIDVTTEDGTTYRVEKDTFHGHPSDPLEWDDLERKFDAITGEHLTAERRDDLVATIRSLEDHDVSELCSLLS